MTTPYREDVESLNKKIVELEAKLKRANARARYALTPDGRTFILAVCMIYLVLVAIGTLVGGAAYGMNEAPFLRVLLGIARYSAFLGVACALLIIGARVAFVSRLARDED